MTTLPGSAHSAGYDLPEPSDTQLHALADELGLDMDDATFASVAARVRASASALRMLRALPPVSPASRHPRTAGGPPAPGDNPHNGWSWRCEVRGDTSGPLAGTTVAVKESVCVSGVPMSNGSALLEGHVPQFDATVVTRLLDAGAVITGKATTENLGLSSGSNTSVTGAVDNPAGAGHSVGGSSSGCAALVASGACDLAVGTDQGGSVRNPASLCGIYGLKPTFGTVPYTGVLSIETSLDHVGFFARDLELIAAALAATAGPDGLDPRQAFVAGAVRPPDARALRFGVLREGVDAVAPDTEATERVAAVTAALRASGAVVGEASLPEHTLSALVATPIYAEGITSQLFQGGGTSLGWKGFYPEAEIVATSQAIRATPNLVPDTGKLFSLLGAYLRRELSGRYYARAQNIGVALRARYDELLADHDVLLMPACAPFAVAQPLPEAPTPDEVFDAGFGYHLNTAIFNITGHPAISLPAGTIRELPFGVMLVGPMHGEELLLAAARHLDDVLRATEGQRHVEVATHSPESTTRTDP